MTNYNGTLNNGNSNDSTRGVHGAEMNSVYLHVVREIGINLTYRQAPYFHGVRYGP